MGARFPREGEAGSTLPFMIKDKTPRDFRVRPSASVSGAGAPLRGVGTVVLGVQDLDSSTALFRRLYGWEEPETNVELLEGATLARFEGTPVTLAAPRGQGWLSERLAAFGPSPCAFLLDAVDLDSASRSHPLGPRKPWFDGKRLSWLHPMKDRGIMLGVLGA